MDIGKQQRVIVVAPLEEPAATETLTEQPQPAPTVAAGPIVPAEERESEAAPV